MCLACEMTSSSKCLSLKQVQVKRIVQRRPFNIIFVWNAQLVRCSAANFRSVAQVSRQIRCTYAAYNFLLLLFFTVHAFPLRTVVPASAAPFLHPRKRLLQGFCCRSGVSSPWRWCSETRPKQKRGGMFAACSAHLAESSAAISIRGRYLSDKVTNTLCVFFCVAFLLSWVM